jgi:predicted PurR-regulated permease PerM
MRGAVEPPPEPVVPRVISFIVLLAIVLLVGAVFFQVMAQFMVPLFLACVLLVVFEPLHAWIRVRIPRWPRLAALLTTVLILLSVLLPLVWLGWNAYIEFHDLLSRPTAVAGAGTQPSTMTTPRAAPRSLTPQQATTPITVTPETEKAHEEEVLSVKLKNFMIKFVNDLLTKLHITSWKLDDETAAKLVGWASSFVGNFVLTGVKSAIGILVGLLIMVISLYYFLLDGPGMIRALMRLSPLDARYERELLERFGQVSRAVVVATLLSAVVQGALAGIGYYFALPKEAPIFLLTAATMITAMIPFFGAAAMWICVCGWVYLYGELTTALILAVYCTVVVSGIDNVIKPLVLHGQSNLHPLLALLSILGGVTVLGPVGIIVGPMVVSFLQALLNMLRKELELFGESDAGPTKQLAEAMAGAAHVVAETAESIEGELAPAKPANKPAKADKPSRAAKLMRFRRGKRKR